MYRYDEFDEAIVRERVAQFSDQVVRRLAEAFVELPGPFPAVGLLQAVSHPLANVLK